MYREINLRVLTVGEKVSSKAEKKKKERKEYNPCVIAISVIPDSRTWK